MQLSHKSAAIALIAAAAVAAAAYTLGRRQGTAVDAPAPQLARNAAVMPVQAQVPAAPQPAGASAGGGYEGKVVAPDPNDKFSHFRVGNKNVKSLYADGKVMWVGTSGGAIRYDTAADDYKVFDARNGLLSNGIFFVGKIQGRITVGTYGGGMALLDQSGSK